MTKDNNCPKCGSYDSWSRWMKKQDKKDHRQYRFCTQCYQIQYREQPKSIKEKVKRSWRKDIFAIDAKGEWKE